MPRLLDPEVWTDRVFTGRWEPPRGGTCDDVEPATGDLLGRVGYAGADDVRAACQAAAAAQPAWEALDYAQRARILLDAAALIRQHHEELVEWIMRECGGVRAKADIELHQAQQELEGAAALLHQPFGVLLPTAVPGRRSIAQRVPYGVVGVISPWNFPLITSIRSVAPALALGNAVVLKPDLNTPIAGGFLIARALEEAGLPEGVLHVLPGSGGDAGSAVVEDPNTSMISFTGSTGVGRVIGETAGRLLKKVALELGANNPFVVLEDADVELAVSAGAWGSFLHQGQICMASGRHLVHRSIYDDYVDALTEKTRRLRVGDPFREDVDLGPIINRNQLERLDEIVRKTLDGGAQATTGAQYQRLFYEPTVLRAVSPDNPAYHEEVFGPVARVIPFGDDDEAVALANGTEYGLKAAVHSGSFPRAMAVGRRLRAGGVHVNETTINEEAVAPFPATKASGTGAVGGPANWEEFTHWQWLTMRGEPLPMPMGGG